MEEVLDQMGIGRFSIMAHSAGGPYALSFANRMADRVQGEICLLAPWVGGGENCKWFQMTEK
jgi:pimeloyl-ACP methyl ester carboxylesterase